MYKKLGVLAGGGDMPRLLVEACRAQGIEPFVVTFAGQDDFDWLPDDVAHVSLRLGQAGAVMKALRGWGISDLVLLGSLQKPSLIGLMPDLTAMKFLLRYGYRAGDDGLLSALRQFLEGEDFVLHGAQRFMPDLVTPAGLLGTHPVVGDIEVGVQAALDWGVQDKGQSVIVRGGRVVAREAREGTDSMIRSNDYSGGVLVKMCKPQQDKDLDLPTIGLGTVRAAVEAGLTGIGVHAGASFFLDREEAIALADKHGIFIVGVEP